MSLSVSEALGLELMDRMELLAGGAGLQNEISWVHIVEVFDDPYFLSPNILLLTTGYGMRDNLDLQRSVFAAASKTGVAAIVVKVGYELKSVPDSMLGLADRYDLPLIQMPQEIPFWAISKVIGSHLLGQDLALARESQAILRRLMNGGLEQRGFENVCRILGEALGLPAFVTGRRGRLLSSYLPQGTPADREARFSERLRADRNLERHLEVNRIVAVTTPPGSSEPTLFIAPILLRGRHRGIVGLTAVRPLTELDLRALESAALVAALEYHAQEIEEATETRLGEALLDQLLSKIPPKPGLAPRLNARGYEIGSSCRLVMIEVGGNRPAHSGEQLRPLIQQHCERRQYDALLEVTEYGIRFLALFAGNDPAGDREELSGLRNRLARYLPGATLWLGASRPTTPFEGLADSLEEAELALAVVRRRSPASGGALCSEELGLDGLLLDMVSSARVREYAQRILQGVLDYDNSKGRSHLQRTLETYLAQDCDTQRTAEALYLHPNTVRYRLRAVEELTGRSLASQSDRTAFLLALRLVALLDDDAENERRALV